MAYCDAPGVCADCGYQGDIWVEHERNWEYHYNETEHWMICPRCQEELDRCSHRSRCTESVCSSCGAPLSGITAEVDHQIDETWYTDATHHWRKCTDCGIKMDYEEHVASCLHPGICRACGNPCDKVSHNLYGDIQYDNESHWQSCWDCGEVIKESHILVVVDSYTYCSRCGYAPTSTDTPTDAPTDTPTDTPTDAPTDTPTDAPTDTPTDAPTDAPTDTSTDVPTDTPTDVPAEIPTAAPTAAPTDAPTAAPTDAPHQHVFRKYVSRGDGTHRSDCEECGVFTVENCLMQKQVVNGIPCEVCSTCGYTVTSLAATEPELPKAPMEGAVVLTAEGEAPSVLVYDLTAFQPEGSAFALCLEIVPEAGTEMPGSVQVTVPCSLDMTNLRLYFLVDGKIPMEVIYGVNDGKMTFTAFAPGIYVLMPVQQ